MNPPKQQALARDIIRDQEVEAQKRSQFSVKVFSEEDLKNALEGLDPRVDIVLCGNEEFNIFNLTCRATDNVKVIAAGRSVVTATDHANVRGLQHTKVYAHDESRVTVDDYATAWCGDFSSINARGSSSTTFKSAGRIYATENAHVVVSGPGKGTLEGESSCEVYHADAELSLYEGATAEAVEAGTVELFFHSEGYINTGGKAVVHQGGTAYKLGAGAVIVENGGAVHERGDS